MTMLIRAIKLGKKYASYIKIFKGKEVIDTVLPISNDSMISLGCPYSNEIISTPDGNMTQEEYDNISDALYERGLSRHKRLKIHIYTHEQLSNEHNKKIIEDTFFKNENPIELFFEDGKGLSPAHYQYHLNLLNNDKKSGIKKTHYSKHQKHYNHK